MDRRTLNNVLTQILNLAFRSDSFTIPFRESKILRSRDSLYRLLAR